MANNARGTLVASFKTLFDSGKYTDLLITCGSDKYKVHKAVVCIRSGFFERAERFPVPAGKEAEIKCVDLPEDEPPLIKLLIQYMYEGEYQPKLPDSGCMEMVRGVEVRKADTPLKKKTGKVKISFYSYNFPHSCHDFGGCGKDLCSHHTCSNNCDSDCVNFECTLCASTSIRTASSTASSTATTLPPAEGGRTQLLLHTKIYEIADKYDVHGLKDLAREKFLRASAEFWDSEEFAPAAHYAFSTTPEGDKGLRDVIINIISKHMALLNKPVIEALLTEFNGLALGLLKMRANDLGWTKSA